MAGGVRPGGGDVEAEVVGQAQWAPTPTPVPRGRVATIVMVVATVAVVLTTFLPWLRTGEARRSSYQVLVAADRLDVLPGWPHDVVAVVWAFLPLAGTTVLLAAIRGHRRVAAAVAGVVGTLVAVVATMVKNAPRVADDGTTAALVSGLVLIVAAAAVALTTRRSQ